MSHARRQVIRSRTLWTSDILHLLGGGEKKKIFILLCNIHYFDGQCLSCTHNMWTFRINRGYGCIWKITTRGVYTTILIPCLSSMAIEMTIWSYTNIPCLGLSTWCNRISWAVESSKTILDRRSAPSCMATRSSGNPNSSSINDLRTNNYESLYYKGVTLCLLLLIVNLPEKLTVTHLVHKYPTSRIEKTESFGMWCCVVRWVVPDVSMEYRAFMFKVKQSKILIPWRWKQHVS